MKDEELDPEAVIKKMSPGEIAQNAINLVMAENESLKTWRDYNDYERAVVLAAVRETMLRLLKSPHWIPASLKASAPDRLDVTFSVDLSDMERALERLGYQRDQDLQDGLKELVRRYRGSA